MALEKGLAEAIETFMETKRLALQLARGEKGSATVDLWAGRGWKQETDDEAGRLWRLLREAKLFLIQPQTYITLHHGTDVWITEELCGFDWKPLDLTRTPTPEDLAEGPKIAEMTTEAGHALPPAEALPFDVCFLAFGQGMRFKPEQMSVYFPGEMVEQIGLVGAELLGAVLTTNDNYWVIYRVQQADGTRRLVYATVFSRTRMMWPTPRTLHPWILTCIAEMLTQYRSFIEEGDRRLSYRMAVKKIGKQLGIKRPIPPPYYIVKMQTTEIKERMPNLMGGGRVKRHYSHRFDVARHERVYFKRGKLPITREDHEKYTARGYKIYMPGDDYDDELKELLVERGKHLRHHDEWTAIKVTEVAAHQSPNDESLPYIPATRVP